MQITTGQVNGNEKSMEMARVWVALMELAKHPIEDGEACEMEGAQAD